MADPKQRSAKDAKDEYAREKKKEADYMAPAHVEPRSQPRDSREPHMYKGTPGGWDSDRTDERAEPSPSLQYSFLTQPTFDKDLEAAHGRDASTYPPLDPRNLRTRSQERLNPGDDEERVGGNRMGGRYAEAGDDPMPVEPEGNNQGERAMYYERVHEWRKRHPGRPDMWTPKGQ